MCELCKRNDGGGDGGGGGGGRGGAGSQRSKTKTPHKDVGNKLRKKLKSVKNTNEYRSYDHNKLSLSLAMKKALTKYAIKNKFRVQEGVSAFKRYANNLTLVNRHFQGEEGLSMIVHQQAKLSDFLKKNRNMKLNIRAEGLFNKPEIDEDEEEPEDREVLYKLPPTRFNVHNEDDLTQAIEDSVKQILFLQIEK